MGGVRNMANNPGTEGQEKETAAYYSIRKRPDQNYPLMLINKIYKDSYAPVTEGVAFLKREKEKKKSKSEVSN